MPLASTLAILSLLDGPVGVDPAFHIIWARFRMIRRCLAYCLEEEPRIFRRLDLISRGAQGHGPVHLLLISAAEVEFASDGEEKGWVPVSLPPLRMMSGPVNLFSLLSWMLGVIVFWPSWLRGRVLGCVSLWILKVLYNYLPLPFCGKEIKCC